MAHWASLHPKRLVFSPLSICEIWVHPAINGTSDVMKCDCFRAPYHADCPRGVGI